MRMAGINFHRELQEVEGPNRSWRAGAFDGQLALNLTAHAAEPSVVGAFVGAALTYDRKGKQHSNQCKHSRVTRGSTIRLRGARKSFPWAGRIKDLVPKLWEYHTTKFDQNSSKTSIRRARNFSIATED